MFMLISLLCVLLYRSRRVITGPKWEALSESRFPVDDSIDEMEGRLDIDYVDPGRYTYY